MRELIVTENITIDGVIDATGGWFAPAGYSDVDESDQIEVVRDQFRAADAVLFGRVTFEEMRSFWPTATDDESGISEYLDQVQKYVVSSTIGDPEWEPTTVLHGLDDVRAIKEQEGRDIVCTGSLTLVPALIAAGLVDEYRLFTHPVVLGKGQRLFEYSQDLGRLEPVESLRFRSGVVMSRYRTT